MFEGLEGSGGAWDEGGGLVGLNWWKSGVLLRVLPGIPFVHAMSPVRSFGFFFKGCFRLWRDLGVGWGLVDQY